MKNTIKILSFVLVIISIATVFASCGILGLNKEYMFSIKDDGTAYSFEGISGKTSKKEKIPSEHKGLPVTSIGERAFAYLSCEKVTIPDSITHISKFAFAYCDIETIKIPASVLYIDEGAFLSYSLKNIEVDEDNPNYKSVDGVLYTKDGTKLVQYPAGKKGTSYDIPNGVLSIGYGAFGISSKLEKISIPDSVVSVCDNAFSDCENLSEIIIPPSVKSIGAKAFYNCAFKSFNIPEGVEKIHESLLDACEDLTSVSIPSTVNEIESSKDGMALFNSCYNLAEIYVADDNDSYSSADGVLYSADGSYMISYPSSKPDSEFVIPDSVTAINPDVFLNNIYLSSVVFGNGVTEIYDNMFANTNISSVHISDSIKTIGSRAFAYCKNLKSIRIPEGVEAIENEAFLSSGVIHVEFAENSKLSEITEKVFADTQLSQDFKIPEGVTEVYKNAFPESAIVEEDGVKYVDNWAVAIDEMKTSCTVREGTVGIAGIRVGNPSSSGSSYVQGESFYLNGAQVQIVPDVYVMQFNPSYSGTSIDFSKYHINGFPFMVEKFGAYSFLNGTAMNASKDAVRSVNSRTINAKAARNYYSAVSEYDTIVNDFVIQNEQQVEINGEFANIIGNSSSASVRNTNLHKIVLPNSLRVISSGAFYNYEVLEDVSLPENLEYIGNKAFYGCREIKNMEIPDSVTHIGYDALTNTGAGEIFGSVQYVGDWAVDERYNQSKIELTDGIRGIASNTFYNSKALSISIPASVNIICRDAFSSCSGLENIIYRGTVDEWNAIEKEENWSVNSLNYIIKCQDGIIENNTQ